jgi:hypothetical protein
MTDTPAAPTTPTGRDLLAAPDVLLMMSGDEVIGLNEGELELQVLAIEAEARSTPAEALDVERLAQAMDKTWVETVHRDPMGRISDLRVLAADTIAQLRLRSPESDPVPYDPPEGWGEGGGPLGQAYLGRSPESDR